MRTSVGPLEAVVFAQPVRLASKTTLNSIARIGGDLNVMDHLFLLDVDLSLNALLAALLPFQETKNGGQERPERRQEFQERGHAGFLVMKVRKMIEAT